MSSIWGMFTSSIRRRILSSFSLIILLVLVVALAGYYQLNQVISSSQQMIPKSSRMGALQDFALASSALDADLERFFVIGGEQFRENILQDLDNMTAALESVKEGAITEEGLAPEELEALKELEQTTTQLRTDVQTLLEMGSSTLKTQEVNQRIISVYALIDHVKQLHQGLSTKTLSHLQDAALGQGRIASGVITQFLILGILVLVIAVLASLFVTRSVANPLDKLAEASRQIAGGDLTARAPVTSRDEVGALATSFNTMADRVSSLLTSLEARTRALETSAQVSRRLSTILDQKDLVAEVVTQLQQAFGYYHVHIYLVDEASGDPSTGSGQAPATGSGQALVMAGGTGPAGREMLARGHRVPHGKGVVGRAAEAKAAVLVPDVSQDEGWLPNPLLPDTRSEIAVPIAAGERVLGVLDVQQDVAGGLGQADADLLSSIAGQVAVALQNTRLFAETRQRAEYEARVNLISQNIQRAASLESLLQVAAREVGQALGAQRVAVQLAPSADGDQLRQPQQEFRYDGA
jgi:GAF domain-containing protein/HAMP domain-containing protein